MSTVFKIFLAVLFSFWIFITLATPHYTIPHNSVKVGSAPPNMKAMYPPVIQLIGEDGNFVCTAIVFDSKYAVTAGHCLDGENFTIRDERGHNTGIKAKRACRIGRTDYGVITGNFNNFMWARLDVYDYGFLRKGPFLACGFPYGQKQLTCIPFKPKANYGFATAGRGFLVPGMSGGPVIDMATGIVVAVNFFAEEGFVGVTPLLGLFGACDIEPDVQ